jgi:hypothetical protein
MSIQFLNGQILFENGMIAMHPDCCCDGSGGVPLDCNCPALGDILYMRDSDGNLLYELHRVSAIPEDPNQPGWTNGLSPGPISMFCRPDLIPPLWYCDDGEGGLVTDIFDCDEATASGLVATFNNLILSDASIVDVTVWTHHP